MAYFNVNGRKIPYSMSAPSLSAPSFSSKKGPSNRYLEYGIIIGVIFLIFILASRKK